MSYCSIGEKDPSKPYCRCSTTVCHWLLELKQNCPEKPQHMILAGTGMRPHYYCTKHYDEAIGMIKQFHADGFGDPDYNRALREYNPGVFDEAKIR